MSMLRKLFLLIAASAFCAHAGAQVAASAKSKKPQIPKAAKAAKPKPPAHDPKAARIVSVPRLGEVTIYAPPGEPRGFALFASGDGGWNLGVWDMAQTAANLGYVVAGFSTPAFLKAMESDDAAQCSDASGFFDRIAETVRSQMHVSSALKPLLIGYSSGATVAYAGLAQAPAGRYSGAMTLGFCPDLIIHKPFCRGAGLTAEKQTKPPYGAVFNTVPEAGAPWIVLQGEIDQVCNPPDTISFVQKVKNGKVVNLPHVGHGYGVPKNWMPQYRDGLIELRDAQHK
jgi:type IV secretory pathway VirJ component